MEPKPALSKDVMSVPEAGARLGMKQKASYDAANRGMFPTVRNGRRIYVPIPAFERWLAGVDVNLTWPQRGDSKKRPDRR